MYVQTHTAVLHGVEALPVDVQCHAESGLPKITLTGLPDSAVREGISRVFSAARLSGFDMRFTKRITINFVPSDLRKSGSAFDLPIALCMLAARGELDPQVLANTLMFGELGLDGELLAARGVLSLASEAKAPLTQIMVPLPNLAEARASSQVSIVAPATLKEAVEHLSGEAPLTVYDPQPLDEIVSHASLRSQEASDMRDVRGQLLARRALEVAAAGGHNLLFIGPPGAGKTLLARCLPGILPPLDSAERLEASRIHSVAGLLCDQQPLLVDRPFRAPHATISDAGLIGSGRPPHIGEISLAHRGVLFLDEFPEFGRRVIEQLRQPLEDGEVLVSRASLRVHLPSRFMLVAAMNPCPCGNLGDPRRMCRCSEQAIERYRGRISGPILDRIDLHVELPSLPYSELMDAPAGEPSAVVRERVVRARVQQQNRYREHDELHDNAGLKRRHLNQWCQCDERGSALLADAAGRLALSARAMDRVLRVARTLADLGGEARIGVDHVAEALSLRCLDRSITG